jgi:hypothetical protein
MHDAEVVSRIAVIAEAVALPRRASSQRWWPRLPAPMNPTSRQIWLLVTPIWGLLALSRVMFYALERMRFPQIVPPVVADAIQAVLLWPLVMIGCYLILRAWGRFGLQWAILIALMSTAMFGALARPAYAIGSLLNSQSEAARLWLAGFGSTSSGFLVPWFSNALEYGVLYLSCVALVAGLLAYRSLMNERLLLSRVEATAAQERLRALRAQLNPHFLFNALNSIVCLNESQSREAQRVILQLSELLRRTLRASEREEHPLTQELAHLDAYLKIECIRHPARIDWRTRVAPGCGAAFVPSLLLLPLVENAVTHGLSGTERVAIEIDVECTRRNLVLRITNSCLQAGHGKSGCAGMGLRNVRERLDVSFGPRARMTLHRPAPDRYEARITLPLRREATAHELETVA